MLVKRGHFKKERWVVMARMGPKSLHGLIAADSAAGTILLHVFAGTFCCCCCCKSKPVLLQCCC
jgi:hypothetical protein